MEIISSTLTANAANMSRGHRREKEAASKGRGSPCAVAWLRPPPARRNFGGVEKPAIPLESALHLTVGSDTGKACAAGIPVRRGRQEIVGTRGSGE